MGGTVFRITFCQEVGNFHHKNQDALFNGEKVFQYQLKKVESILIEEEEVVLGVADGISGSSRSQLASRFLMEKLSECGDLNSAWLRSTQLELCEKYTASHFGIASTFVGCELQADGKGKILNVGDSRAYKITATGVWQQLSVDHTVLAEMQLQGLANENTEYASMYNALSDCLVADFEAGDFRLHNVEFQLEKGDCLLLCSDALPNYFSPTQLDFIWKHNSDNAVRLHCYKKLFKKGIFRDDFSVIMCEIL